MKCKKKETRGRPRIDNPLVRRQIRATDDQWESWQLQAFAEGMTLSSWVRNHLNKRAKKYQNS